MAQPSLIESLPSELLDDILVSFPTRTLIAFAGVSRRFHDLVARILYRRLRRAVSQSTYQLILECYHPSAKVSTPYLYCNYLGTDGLDVDGYEHTGHLSGYSTCYASSRSSRSSRSSSRTHSARASRDPSPDLADEDPESLHHFLSLYSRFRPEPQDPEAQHMRARRAWRRPEAVFRLETARSREEEDKKENTGDRLASQDLSLDEDELFSQLCVVTNLVKTGPRRGLFHNCVNISDGIIRVWRDWLAGRAADCEKEEHEHEHGHAVEWYGHGGVVLWADADRRVGLRFRVRERECDTTQTQAQAQSHHHHAATPLFMAAPPDRPVRYTLEYEELLVRTSELLLAVEDAEEQETAHAASMALVVV